jgi:hypothetical protein
MIFGEGDNKIGDPSGHFHLSLGKCGWLFRIIYTVLYYLYYFVCGSGFSAGTDENIRDED